MRKKNQYTFVGAVIDWLKSKPQLTEASRIAYKGEINRLAEYFANVGIRNVHAASKEGWCNYLVSLEKKRDFVATKRTEKLLPGSIQQARRITRDFFMWALEQNIIKWVPRLSDAKFERKKPSRPPREISEINVNVAHMLIGDVEPKNISDTRVHMAFNLIFWGAMKPAMLATLKVRDLSDSGILSTSHLSSKRKVQLPDHVINLWRHYREARKQISGDYPKQSAPLICRIEDELPLSAWGIWSIFNEWHKKYSNDDNDKLTPRNLRITYLELLCGDGASKLKLACAQGGIREKRVLAEDSPVTEKSMSTANRQIRSYLQTRLN